MATNLAVQKEALSRAVSSQSLANYTAIISGFMRKGIAESEIKPRENVFTYNAWKALGRQVRKGEHGVRCLTFIVTTDKRTGREEKRPWSTTVFHVSQTDAVGSQNAAPRVPACQLEPDATPDNVPYAGEEETETAELLEHSAAVHASRQEPEQITPEVIPAPEPKDSAYNRAMRGEVVSIMDIIAEQQPAWKPERAKTLSYPYRRDPVTGLRSAVQSFQTKDVDF